MTVALRTYLFRKMPDADILVTVEMFFPVIPLIALIFFRYARPTYYVTVPSLVWFNGSGIKASLESIERLRNEGVGMFVVGMAISIGLTALIGLLTWKYTFGRPSRAYYGFAGKAEERMS